MGERYREIQEKHDYGDAGNFHICNGKCKCQRCERYDGGQ